MDNEKERIARWRAERQRRRNEERAQSAKRAYSSLFAIDAHEQGESAELEAYLLRQNLAKGNLTRRMGGGEVRSALRSWSLEELGQLWSMRREKLTYLEDAALLLSHIRHRSGIDTQLRSIEELLGYEAVRTLGDRLEERGTVPSRDLPTPSHDAEVAEGKRVEQVRRVIREGQAEFRKRLLAHYGAACMVTGTAEASVIDAAHIVPYNGAATNALSNGLLLRKDIHAMFDAGLLMIGSDLFVYVAERVRDPHYRSLDGKELRLTASAKMSQTALQKRLSGDTASELEVR